MAAPVPHYGSAKRDYVVVGVDYAYGCAGACPACVLSQEERDQVDPVGQVGPIVAGLRSLGERYGEIGTLALGIGRANVLALDPDVAARDVGILLSAAASSFRYDVGGAEITTSLIGKVDVHIARARRLAGIADDHGFDARFVVVGNTALASRKYWAKVDEFLRALEAHRGGGVDSGDILQLTLATDSLPDPAVLAETVADYRFAINTQWAPLFDAGAGREEALARLDTWLSQFYVLGARLGLDSSLNTRVDAALATEGSTLADAVALLRCAVGSVAFVDPTGVWHEGFFSVLAEMDPVRYATDSVFVDGHGYVVGDPVREVTRLHRNPACAACPHFFPCVAGGTYRLALSVLRRFPSGTRACPCAMRSTYELAAHARGEEAA